MTILAGALHNGKIFLGSDSLYSYGSDFVKVCKTSKFLKLDRKDVLIAGCGQDRYSQILGKLLKEYPELLDFSCLEDVELLAESFNERVKDISGVGGAAENELPSHEFAFMLATSSAPYIWTIHEDYAVDEVDSYTCSGSGYIIGESAFLALSKKNIFGKEAVRIAIECASDLNPSCGGPTVIKELTIKGT